MIIARIDEDRFLDLVRKAPVIAFQRLEFGFAVAAPGEAYYAPTDHPGGGNLDIDFKLDLGGGFLFRAGQPHLRTLRPTAKPIPSAALIKYLQTLDLFSPEPMSGYPKAAGDHPAVVDSECQVVIQAIEEHQRPDLKDAMIPAKRDVMSDAIDFVIQHADAVRDLAEVGDYEPRAIQFHLLQASRALQTCLSLLLKP
jgi:hypothetical protein